MNIRRVTHEQAEAAFTSEFKGSAFNYGDICGAEIEAVSLAEVPLPGGGQGKGYVPLTYKVAVDGRTETIETEDGPQVDELRAFLYATLPDRQLDDKLELWFEDEVYPGGGGGCGC